MNDSYIDFYLYIISYDLQFDFLYQLKKNNLNVFYIFYIIIYIIKFFFFSWVTLIKKIYPIIPNLIKKLNFYCFHIKN